MSTTPTTASEKPITDSTSQTSYALEFLSVGAVAAIADISERQVWRWIREEKLPVHDLGRAVRIKRSDLESFFASLKRRSRVSSCHVEAVKIKSS